MLKRPETGKGPAGKVPGDQRSRGPSSASGGAQPGPETVVAKPKRRVSTRHRMRQIRKMPTIGGMRTNCSGCLKVVLVGFVAVFAITGIFSFSTPHGDDGSGQAEEKRLADPVMSVGGAKMTLARWTELNQPLNRQGDMLTMRYQQAGQMADSWIRQEVELGMARARGLKVSRQEVDAAITKQIDDAMAAERGGMDERQWRYALQKDTGGLKAKQDDLQRQAEKNRDQIADGLLLEKLRKAVDAEVTLSDQQYADALSEVGGRVLLLRTTASKPAPLGEGQTESPELKAQREQSEKAYREALAAKKPEAEKVLAQLKAKPTSFAEVAKAQSDDVSTKDKGGELALGNRDAFARYGEDFAKAALATPNGQISNLIEGPDGWLIFMATKHKTFPKDFATADPRTFEQAEQKAQELEAKLKAGADFATVAKESSDDPGSAEKGGDLGEVRHGMMVKPFDKMVFALPKDEISAPFRSQFGVHIVQVTERTLPQAGESVPETKDPEPDPEDKAAVAEAEALKKLPLPKTAAPPAISVKARHILVKAEDPAKKVEDTKQQLLDRKRSEHFEELVKEARAKAQADGSIHINDPALQAWFAQNQGEREQSLLDLRAASVQFPTTKPEARLQLAQDYEMLAQTQAYGQSAESDQIAAVQALAKDPAAGPDLVSALDSPLPGVRTAVANALGDLKAKEAVAKLTEMVKNETDTVAAAAVAALQKIGAPVPERKISGSPDLTPGAAPAGAAPTPPVNLNVPLPPGG